MIFNLEPDDIPLQWFRSYPHSPYRNYRAFSAEQRDHLLKQRLGPNKVLATGSAEAPEALVWLTSLEWDSRVLQLPCGRLGFLWNSEHRDRLEGLLEAAVARARQLKIQHLTCQFDTSDIVALDLMQRQGFQVVDTRLTYLFDKMRDQAPASPGRYRVRTYESDDRVALEQIASQMLWGLEGRFYADPALGPEAAGKIYTAWAQGCLAEASDYRVAVALNGSQTPVGFLCYRYCPETHRLTGKRMFGRGLAAVVPDAGGAYLDLLAATIAWEIDDGDLAEYETSVVNQRSYRVFEHLGFRLARSSYVVARTL